MLQGSTSQVFSDIARDWNHCVGRDFRTGKLNWMVRRMVGQGADSLVTWITSSDLSTAPNSPTLPTPSHHLTIPHSVDTLKEMEKRFALKRHGVHLWTREKARQIRSQLTGVLEGLATGDVLVIDAAGVEVFDFSFANELFGKMISSLAAEHPGRFVIVENLTEYASENLSKALESSNLMMIERQQGKFGLLGKVHPADRGTFAEIVSAGLAVSASALSKKLEVNLTAMNERLSKLTNLGIVRRERGSSASGREQYVYRLLN
jgi:hypothetical protein